MDKSFIFRLKRASVIFMRELNADPDRRPYMGDKYYCPICKTGLAHFDIIDQGIIDAFDKYEYNYPIFSCETLNFFNYHCPKCHASDRDRLFAMYLNKIAAGIDKDKKLSFIDFAPQPGLAKFFKSMTFLNYRSADLYMEGVDDKVDITDMKIYKDNSIDAFVCSHILEHVKEDKKAMKELYRILKPGGWGIAMVPILLTSDHIIEDLPIETEAELWKFYGQGDHVRFYNKSGFIDRLKEAGFKVNLYGKDYFGAAAFEKNGIHHRSVLYIVEKI